MMSISRERFADPRLVGSGGFGDVYSVYDCALERLVAIKCYRLPISELTEIRQSLTTCIQLRHPHVVQILDLFENTDKLYLVQTYCEGGSLEKKLDSGELEPILAIKRFLELAGAVDYLHSCGLLHRDLKLSNVLLDSDGQSVLIDFDQCLSMETAKKMRVQEPDFLGTAEYLAPELLDATSPPSVATEIYALGVILFELLSGRRVSQYKNLAQSVIESRTCQFELEKGSVEEFADWNAIIAKATNPRPVARYSNVEALIADVTHQLQGKPISVRSLGRLSRGKKWIQRNPRTSSLILTSTVLFSVAVVLSSFAWLGSIREQVRAGKSTTELQRKRDELNAARQELDKLIAHVKLEVEGAVFAENEQKVAAEQAQQIESQLAEEAEKTERLRQEVEQTLARVQASQAELAKTRRQSSEVTEELKFREIQNAVDSYTVQFRKAWAAVQDNDWEVAKRIAEQLEENYRSVEYQMLLGAISNQLSKPSLVTIDKYRLPRVLKGDEQILAPMPLTMPSLGRYFEANTGNAIRHVIFQRPRNEANYVLQIHATYDEMYAESQQTLLLDCLIEIPGRDISGLITILPDGSFAFGVHRQSRRIGIKDTSQDIVVLTFAPSSYAEETSVGREEFMAKLRESKTALTALNTGRVVHLKTTPWMPSETDINSADATEDGFATELLEIGQTYWAAENLKNKVLGILRHGLKPMDSTMGFHFELKGNEGYSLSVSPNRELLWTNQNTMCFIDLQCGKFAVIEKVVHKDVAFDSKGNIFLLRTSGEGLAELFYIIREKQLSYGFPGLKVAQTGDKSIARIGGIPTISCPYWFDSDHLYLTQFNSRGPQELVIKRFSLPLQSSSPEEIWFRLQLPREMSVAQVLILSENQVLLRGQKVSLLFDRQRAGMWVSNRALGTVALVPDTGEMIVVEQDGKLYGLSLELTSEMPPGFQ